MRKSYIFNVLFNFFDIFFFMLQIKSNSAEHQIKHELQNENIANENK